MSGYPTSIEAQKSQITLVNEQESKMENLHQLLNVRTMRILHLISLWSRYVDRLINPNKDEDKKEHKR